MDADSFDALTAAQLSRLLDVDRPARWDSRDAAAALRHQLAAPLWPDVAAPPAAEPARITAALAAAAGQPITFLGQLTAALPQLDLLRAIKLFARHHRADPDSPLAGPPATILYYAALAAALLRHQQRITHLANAAIRQGCQWALDQPGAEDLRPLFAAVLESVAKPF